MKRCAIFFLLPPLFWTTQVLGEGEWQAFGDPAFTMGRGEFGVGLLTPFRYGICDRVELFTYPVLDLLDPNGGVRVRWFEPGGWIISSLHYMSYPSPFLRTIARRGSFGILPDDSDIPQIISLWNEVQAGRWIHPRHHFTGRAGFRIAPGFGESDMPTIDLPIVYPRTAAYQGGAVFNTGVTLSGMVYKSVLYSAGIEVFYIPHLEGNYAIESPLSVFWNLSRRLSFQVGVKYIHGEYPFGTDWHIIPFIDIYFTGGG